MKITLIITGLEVGGGEKQVCDLADQFSLMGHTVQLISLTGNTILKPKCKQIELVELQLTKSPISLFFGLMKARKFINVFKPHIFHSHMVHANIFSRLLKFLTKSRPLICTAHSTNEGGHLRTLAYRYTDWLCNLNTNVSQEAVNVYLEKRTCKDDKIIPVVNGIDVNKYSFNSNFRIEKRGYLGLNNNDFLVLAVGRLCEAKDYPNLISAFQLLHQRNVKVRLVIAGTGELEVRLKKMVENKGLTSHITFLGLCSEVEQFMSAADTFVMSSAWEGLPLVLLEAMACQRPVIATDVGGIKEVLANYGKIVEPNNSEALANAIEFFISTSCYEREAIGVKARDYIVQNYSIQAIADEWLVIYKSCLNIHR